MYSCWEYPRDRGAWRATTHGLAKSQTRLNTHHIMIWWISLILYAGIMFFMMFWHKLSDLLSVQNSSHKPYSWLLHFSILALWPGMGYLYFPSFSSQSFVGKWRAFIWYLLCNRYFFSLFNLTQMTIEPCPPQKSFCATWSGNFGTFDKGIQWGLECSPGKRSKGERAEHRENTTKTPQIIVFHQKKFFWPKCFFQKAYLFSPHLAKWYDHWLKWQSSYVTVFSCALYIYQLYFLWVN